jgi:chorismate mutase / prephenate dehydratase
MAKGRLVQDVENGELESSRRTIDRVDDRILSLLSRRQEIAASIGRIKEAGGLDRYDSAREKNVLDRLACKGKRPLTSEAIRRVFCEIISAARSVQEPFKVSYLGPEATFSHQAAISLFGRSTLFRPAESIQEVFQQVERGACQRGVVPVENSSEGSVSATLEGFYTHELKIGAEFLLRIRHHLLSRADRIDRVTRIYSHPMALAQCRLWFKEHLPGVPLEEVSSTAEAVRRAAKGEGTAAVGSKPALLHHGMNLLVEGIEDHPGNTTRFLVIGRHDAEPTGKDKTSLLFSLEHKPGSLSGALEPLARRKINMTRIESRPLKGRNWEYLFFVDLEGHEKEDLGEALSEMENQCAFLKRLGSYPAGGEVWD